MPTVGTIGKKKDSETVCVVGVEVPFAVVVDDDVVPLKVAPNASGAICSWTVPGSSVRGVV
jgi:hypothetical protein